MTTSPKSPWETYPASLLRDLPAVAGSKADAVAHLEQAKAFISERAYRSAMTELQAAISLDPTMQIAVHLLGVCQLNLGWAFEAYKNFHFSMQMNPDHVPSFMGKAFAAEEMANWSAGISCYSQVLKREPDNKLARERRAFCLTYKNDPSGKSAKRALKDLDKLLAATGIEENAILRVYALAWSHQFEAALALADEMQAREPQNPEWPKMPERIAKIRHQHEELVKRGHPWVTPMPQGTAAEHIAWGWDLINNTQWYTTASDHFKAAIQKDPIVIEEYLKLAEFFRGHNDNLMSLSLLQLAEKVTPGHPLTAFNMACFYAKRAKPSEPELALEWLAKALAGDPSLRQRAAEDKWLKKLAKYPRYDELLAGSNKAA